MDYARNYLNTSSLADRIRESAATGKATKVSSGLGARQERSAAREEQEADFGTVRASYMNSIRDMFSGFVSAPEEEEVAPVLQAAEPMRFAGAGDYTAYQTGNQSLHVDMADFTREGVDLLAMSQSVKDIESGGGNYQARGPVVKKGMYKGQQALGAYQVMPGNLPSWSEAALGRVVSEEEFLADPAIQDTIFLHQMTNSIDRYGTAEDAVSVWFTGKPVAKAGNVSDDYTTAPEYLNKYASGYNARVK